jgi:hypothetical protein
MNRRLFIKTSAGLAAAGWTGHAHAIRTPRAQRAIAIVDPSLIESVRWARAAARDGANVIECGDDVAVLWYEALARTHAPLIGALRASDFFVLRHLARSDGRNVAQTGECKGVISFSILRRESAPWIAGSLG